MSMLSHSAIYFIGNLIRYAASFIMLPIYTNYLSPSEYGTVELLVVGVDLVSIFIGVRLGQGVFRYYTDAKNQTDKSSIINSALIISLITNCIGLLLIYFLSSHYLEFLGDKNLEASYIQFFGLTLLFNAVIEIFLIVVRLNQSPVFFVFFNGSKLLVQIAVNLYFVAYLEQGVIGVIKASVLTSALFSLVAFFLIFKKYSKNISAKYIKLLAVYSAPLLFAEIGLFYITFSDRFVLKYFYSAEAVGIYALAAKFAALLLVFVWTPFQNTWDLEKYRIHKCEDANIQYQEVFKTLNAVLVLAMLLISFFVEELIEILAPVEYMEAIYLAPIMLLGAYFKGITAFVNFGILLKGKTFELAKVSFMSMFVITALYLLLVPELGTFGAAISVTITLGARLLWVYYKAKRLYDMELEWGGVIALVVVSMAASTLILLIEWDFIFDIVLKLILFFLFIYALFRTSYFSHMQKTQFSILVDGLFNRIRNLL